MKKRILSLFMALVMVFSLIPNAVLADVIKAGEKSYDVYTFSVDGAKVQEQTVKVGDTLLEPAAPEKAGYEFTGWYNGGSRFTGFGSVTSVAGTTINLEAKFSEAHYVFFLDDTGRVYTTKQGVTGDVIAADVEFPTEVNESIVGWYTDAALTQKVTSVTLAEENIILYPKVAEGYYLTFDSTGGSYVEPQFVAQGANTAAPANPTRLGYTFSHWSETEGGSAFTFGSTITESKTLYAVWTGNSNTKYTVVYWIENADDENYSYASTSAGYGTAGQVATLSNAQLAVSNIGGTYASSTYYTYSTHDSNRVIAGDGSTIVNVYFDRVEYTFTFKTSRNGSSIYSFSAKWGSNIVDKWTFTGSNGTEYSPSKQSSWAATSGTYTQRIFMLVTMPAESATFVRASGNNSSHTFYYYVESLDNTAGEGKRLYNGKYYDFDFQLVNDFNILYYDEDFFELKGFTRYTSARADGSEYPLSNRGTSPINNLYFYYTRNSYNLDFYNVNTTAKTESVKYEASLAGQFSYVPARPTGIPDSYTFQGWYTSPACEAGTEATANLTTMPDGNLVVFAKWAAPVFDATFYVDVNGTVVKVPYAEAIDKAQIPEVEIPAGYEFIGWTTTKNDLSTLFNLDTKLYGDISLYPYFISTASFSVTYDLDGGSGSVSDSKVYAQDSHADVQSAAGISKANKVFLGWSYGGEIYYPGDKVLMPAANITLTAVWGDVLVTTSLTYKANGGVGDDVVISDLENNALLKAIANPFTREGYTFLGWAKDAGAKAPQFVADEQIRVDIGTNVLYAVWQIDQYEVSYTYTGTVPAGAPALPTTAKHDYNSTVTVADEPTLDGYVFNGWYKDGAEVTSFTMPAKNVELTGEWKIRTDLSYTVNYYWNGTTEKVADSKVVEGQTFNTTATESPIPIDGCTAVSQDSKSVTITTGENVINFYYYKNVALEANSKTEVYDGSEKSVSGFTGAPAGADFSAITVGAKGTVVGEYPAEFAEGTVGTVDATKKYIVTEATDGKLTITPITTEIVVTAASSTQVYNGKALTNAGYTFTEGILVDGDVLTAVVEGTITDVGTVANKVTSYKVMRGETDVTASYTFGASVDGTLTVTKRPVTLTSEGGSKTYDGTPLTKPEVTVEGDGFVAGEVTDIKATGSVTDVDEGEVTNTITYTEGAAFKAGNYDIRKVEGKLSITKCTVTITSPDAEKVYDGTALTNSKVTAEGFVNGEGATYDVTGSQTYVGTSDNTFTYTLNSNTKAANYDITTEFGTLTVTPITTEIVITAASDTKPYDGTALTDDGYTFTQDVLVEGDVLTAVVEGTITNVGTAANKVTSYKVMRGETDVTSSYTFGTSVDGTLEITKRPVTLTSETVSKIYDGSALTNSKVTVDGMGFVDGEVTDIKATGSVTHVAEGAVTNTIEFTPAEGFLADNYTITKNEGQLSIAARMVTLTSATASKVYDGKALTNDTVTVGGSGFVEGEGATYNVTGTQTQEGSSKNTFTYTLNDGTKAENYDITVVEGNLTVTALTDKVTVTITENSGSEKYDGTEKTVTGYTVSIDNELYTEDDFTFSGNDTIKGTDAGSYPMELKPENFTNVSKNFTNVEFVIVDGTLEIAKREVTLTSADDYKTYDGKALTNSKVTVGGDGFVEGEGATYDVTGSQTEEGSSANTFTYTLSEGTKAGNYTITKNEGTLTVFADDTEVVVTITENSGEYTYDGTEKTVTGYKVTKISNDLYKVADFTFNGDATIKGTDAGSYPMELKPEDFTNTSDNFTNVVFVIEDGTLEIAKREVTLTSADDEQVYNGSALTNDTVTVTGDGFVTGEGATYDVTGTQTDVGSSANAFTYTLNDGTKADNYTITKTEGTLTVTPVTDEVVVTIVGETDSKVYNGATQYVKGYQVTDISNPLYKVDDFEFRKEAAIAQGKDIGTYYMGLSAADFQNTSENFTNVRFDVTDGSLEITPKAVTVTADNKTKVYGAADPELTATVTGVVDGESIELIDYTLSREAGEDVGDYTITPAGKAEQGNYTVTYVPGKLTITPVTDEVVVTITENSGEYTYDGTEKTVTGYEVTEISNDLYKVADFTFSGNATVKGTYVGTYNMELKPEDFKNISKNFTNVKFVIEDGTLVINPIADEITITADSNEKVYDGTALTDDGYTFTQDVLVEGDVLTAVVEGTITDVGTTANKVTSYKVMRGETDVTDCYTFGKSVDGTLSITKRPVTITADSNSKVYDGTVLTDDGWKDTAPVNVAATDEVTSVTVEGSILDKGSVANVASGAVIMRGETDVTENYDITYDPGTLTITAITDKIVITADSNTKVYDGTALTDDGYTFTQGVLVEGDELTAVVEGTITNVGEAANVVTSYVVMRGKTDVTANYTFGTSVDGKLTITKRPVTLTSASDSKVYDGTALTNSKVTAEGFVDGEGATYDVTGSQTYVGTSDNTFTYTLNEGTSADNYDITVEEGKLTVTAITDEIVITANSNTKVYDGTALTDDGYTYAEELLAEGDVIVAVVEGTITDAGSADNVVTSYVVMRGETDVTENYTGITTAKGTLTITKRPVTITSPDAEKVYDGTALVNTNVTSEGFVEGEGASYIVTGSQLNVGSSVNEFTYTLNEGTKADNYAVTVEKGTLTVTPVTDKVTVTITEHSGEEVYDGTEKTVEGYDVAIDNALYTENDFAFEGNDSVSGIYAGTYDMELKPENFTNTSANFTNVEFVIVDGALVIKPVETEIVITADSNEKVYDGTALTDDGYTYDQTLLVEGDYIVAVVEGSQTNVGSSANKVTSYQILRGANAAREIVDVTDCYANVTTVDGTLTVTKRPVVLTSGSDSKVYDGTALTKEVVTVSGDGWAAGEGAAYSEFASITNVGSVNNSFTYTLNEGTDAANYDITVVEGVLTVNKYTDAKLEATGYTGVYDGKLHDGVTDKTVTGGVEGDVWTYTYSIDGENFVEEMPQYQDVGTYTVYVKATNPNYEGDALTTTVPVVIAPATIVVTADDHVIATGDPDPELTYQVSTPVETETPAFDGILVRQEGAAKGEYPIEQGTLVLVDGEGFKASNYVLEYVPGTLTILQRAIDVEKTVDVDKAFVGDTITYTFVVTNTGEVDLQNVILIDEMLEIAGEIGALAIGETWTGKLTYVATKEDVGQTLYNTVIVLAEGDTYDEDTSEGTSVYEPVPDTGDHTPVAALSAAMLVSLAGVIVLLRKQRKESAE